MLEVAGGRSAHHRPSTPPVDRRVIDAGGAEARIDALAKLKALLDSGVLTDRQFADELQDLHSQGAVRALDMLRVRRDPDGGLRRLDPSDPEAFSGTVVEALLISDPGGSGDGAAEGGKAEESTGPEPVAGSWSLADRLPRGAAAAIVLLEHRWAIPLREAAAGARAEVFGDAWVHPRDLAAARRAVGSFGQ